METVFNADHVYHESPGELLDGAIVPAFEKPERAALIRARLDEVKLGPVRGPDAFPLAAIEAVHDPRMVALFREAHAEWAAWSAALNDGIMRVRDYGPDVIVVSLGVDSYRRDPISRFRLDHEHFTRMGGRIAALRKPALFVMEGGYAVAEIGVNTLNVLSGFVG